MFEALKNAPRLLIEQKLKPIQGERFQPTGFADLGAADYKLHDGTRMLLVESAQSVANRLERTCLDGESPRLAKELEGLPYVVAKLSGATDAEVSSLVEAHRINSPFIINNKTFHDPFIERAQYKKFFPVSWDKVAEAFFFYDPNSIIHGAFLANKEDSRIRIPRALSGFIEAKNVMEAVSGGVKNSALDPTGKAIRVEDHDDDVYGNVPYQRVEYTADSITAYFNLDLALIAGYRLKPDAQRLLIALSLLKVRRFLSSGLRLRTACDFEAIGEMTIKAPSGFEVPQEAALLTEVQDCIKSCTEQKLFAEPAVTVLHTPTVKKEKDDAKG